MKSYVFECLREKCIHFEGYPVMSECDVSQTPRLKISGVNPGINLHN